MGGQRGLDLDDGLLPSALENLYCTSVQCLWISSMFTTLNSFPSSSRFEQLTQRILRQVNSSAAQERRRTVITRLPEDRIDDWDKLLDQLEVEESVRLLRLDGGHIQLSWTNHHR